MTVLVARRQREYDDRGETEFTQSIMTGRHGDIILPCVLQDSERLTGEEK